MKIIAGLGRDFFGVAFIGLGILQLLRGDFVRLVPELPTGIPWHSFWAGAIGVLLIGSGAAIVTGKGSRPAAALLALLLFLMLAFLCVPQVASNPKAGFMWTNPCKALALLGGALLLMETRMNLTVLASFFFGSFLILGGIQHFVYADFVTKLVPSWMPGLRFWTYFTGVALIAGGMGIVIPKTARWAAILSGLMIFLWVLLLHLPRAFADLKNAGEMAGVFEALALSGVALLISGVRSR